MSKLTQSQRIEKEVAGIREALTELVTNHMPHLKARIGNVEARGAFNTQLILGVYVAVFVAAVTILVTVFVR